MAWCSEAAAAHSDARDHLCVEKRQQSVAACHAGAASEVSSGRAQRASADSLLVSQACVVCWQQIEKD